jgi:DNA replication initiation complex subunit (GINS family)
LDQASVIAGVAVLISGLGMIWTYFFGISSVRKDLTADMDEIRKEQVIQGKSITRLETQTELFWTNVGGVMAKIIKQPIHYRKDDLMDKLVAGREDQLKGVTTQELVELKMILKEELFTLQETKEPKSLAYALAIAYIDQLLYDKGMLNGECQ